MNDDTPPPASISDDSPLGAQPDRAKNVDPKPLDPEGIVPRAEDLPGNFWHRIDFMLRNTEWITAALREGVALGPLSRFFFVVIVGMSATYGAVMGATNLLQGADMEMAAKLSFMGLSVGKVPILFLLTLAIILVLLYLSFRNFTQALMVMAAVPLSLVGGFWLVYLLGYELSVAVAVGFIALAGVAAEFGVVMMVYLDEAVKRHRPETRQALRTALIEGAVQRVRPKAMTAAVIFAGMLPIMFGTGTGSEVMRRIAAPLVGGMVTAPLVSMLLIPVLYLWWKGRGMARE